MERERNMLQRKNKGKKKNSKKAIRETEINNIPDKKFKVMT